ncbi:ankyrin repeat and SOCS box 3 [Fusarium beomiforme]|uniref:Ankyrin repeat and SOCS box 3 n=1 Tax=Fusarium beomiforme TaxID=44412 RepID=A0A9P5A6E1_9HYPO|nr:ankyrin repeat and SOCS box 3 [Fusarium beomiforme]
MSLKDQILYTKMGLLSTASVFMEKCLFDIQTASNIVDEVTIPNLFPSRDFQVDQQGNLVYASSYQKINLDFFSFAAYNNQTNILEVLLVASGPNKTCDQEIPSPLCLSLLNGGVDTAKFLLSNGADPRGISCTNGLHAAARAGSRSIVISFLVEWEIPANCVDAFGFTPAMYALYLEEPQAIEIIDILMRHGASRHITYGGDTRQISQFARAMKKNYLASWLEWTEKPPMDRTIEYIQKQTEQLQLGGSKAEQAQRLHLEEPEAGWVDVQRP